MPIDAARLITLLGLAISLSSLRTRPCARFRFSNESWTREDRGAASNLRRTWAGAHFCLARSAFSSRAEAAAIARKLFRIAAFSYDGTQYKGADVQAITPNDRFYCVTKNVVDPRVDGGLWHLEVTGLVQHPHTYRLLDFKNMEMVDQETTLMCISNGLDAGLMSNAVWRGIPMGDLLEAASPLPGAERVRLHGVDNYTDTVPFQKAMTPTTLIAFKMNGTELPDRHGFPRVPSCRVISVKNM